jgi:hypothetical protein
MKRKQKCVLTALDKVLSIMDDVIPAKVKVKSQ